MWQEYVLDYSDKQQIEIKDSIVQTQLFKDVRRRLKMLKTMFSMRPGGQGSGHSGYGFMNMAGKVGIVILALGFLASIYYLVTRLPAFRNRKVKSHHQQASVEFMNRFIQKLKRRALIRSDGMTPAEWFQDIQHALPPGWDSGFFLEMYHRVRYGGGPLTESEKKKIRTYSG